MRGPEVSQDPGWELLKAASTLCPRPSLIPPHTQPPSCSVPELGHGLALGPWDAHDGLRLVDTCMLPPVVGRVGRRGAAKKEEREVRLGKAQLKSALDSLGPLCLTSVCFLLL